MVEFGADDTEYRKKSISVDCPAVATFNHTLLYHIFTPLYSGKASKKYYKTLDFLITEVKRV